MSQASPLPNPHPAHPNPQQTPSAQHKRSQRRPPHDSQRNAHLDGSVSDSFANTMASPRSRKPPKPRNPTQATAALPIQGAPSVHPSAHKPRHLSSSGDGHGPATPLKESAYAGATFQASPAASTLPVPKFYSKSVPGAKSFTDSRLARASTPAKESPSPESDAVVPHLPGAAQQSSLDALFRADRAEKERSRSGLGHFSPGASGRSPPATEPRLGQGYPGRNGFMRELDGDDSDYSGPSSLPNQHQFPFPARNAHASPGSHRRMPSTNEENEAYTRSLKDMLFNNPNPNPAPANTAPAQPQRPPNSSHSDFEGVFGIPSPSGPSTPAPSAHPPDHQQDYYSLHYGNRNLSPLFKAARNDSTPRPVSSPLRQHAVPSDGASHFPNATGQQPPPGATANHFPQQYYQPQPQYLPHSPPQIRPDYSYVRDPRIQRNVETYSKPEPSASPRPTGPSTAAATSSTGNRDVRSMEDDLRRMLNLNVLSN